MSAEHPAAYTPPVGMKSLERKLMHNGERGADYFEPEWAEVRVVMREYEQMRRVLETLTSVPLTWPPRSEAEWRSFDVTWDAYQKARQILGH